MQDIKSKLLLEKVSQSTLKNQIMLMGNYHVIGTDLKYAKV